MIVNAYCNFIQQLRYPGDVLAKHYVTNLGRTSFDTYITMERSDDPGIVWAEGGARMVWIDFATQKSVPLPDWLRDEDRLSQRSAAQQLVHQLRRRRGARPCASAARGRRRPCAG